MHVGEAVSRIGHALPESLVVDGLAIPRVAGIAQNFVGIGNQRIEVAEVPFIPDFPYEFCQDRFEVLRGHIVLGSMPLSPDGISDGNFLASPSRTL